ncbi:hypothetical protein ISN44_As12g033240 [Arabidopsis suecica]|uniref:Plant thionin family protein n=1 Tax=Arabidopsis suecica TaxID=45249 RepID=A0A8T1YPL1_ARASU|nr:hypothetical protein ISN44_As12g033240 [Arabidopsis suecica]
MENKRMGVFLVMMLMIGTLMVESKAIENTPIVLTLDPICYLKCFELCLLNPIFLIKNKCPEKCDKKCVEHFSEIIPKTNRPN